MATFKTKTHISNHLLQSRLLILLLLNQEMIIEVRVQFLDLKVHYQTCIRLELVIWNQKMLWINTNNKWWDQITMSETKLKHIWDTWNKKTKISSHNNFQDHRSLPKFKTFITTSEKIFHSSIDNTQQLKLPMPFYKPNKTASESNTTMKSQLSII